MIRALLQWRRQTSPPGSDLSDSARSSGEANVLSSQSNASPSPPPLPQPAHSSRQTQSESPTGVRYRVMGWLALAAALSYLCRNAIGVAESELRRDLGLTLTQSGWVLGAFFWTYALLQVPAGSFSQRYGSRIAMTLFAIGWAVAMLATAASPGFWLLITAQLVMGAAQAGIFPASTNTVSHWVPMSQRALGCGLLAVGMQTGAIAASFLTGTLLLFMSWRWTFALFALPSLLWAIVFYARFRNSPQQCPKVNGAELQRILADKPTTQINGNSGKPAPRMNWRDVARNPAIWLICGQQICRASGYMFFASWFPTFLQKTRGVSLLESGILQGWVFTGALAGSLLGGWVTDWIWNRTKSLWLSRSGVGSFALGICGLLILLGWFTEDARTAVGILALGSFFAAFAGPCTFSTTIDIGGAHVPQMLGLVNMSGNLAVAACPVLIGILVDQTGSWDLILVLFSALYLTGALCWLLVGPQRTA